ncbi:MAG: DUF2007 domain-containing protein [Acidobacteriota bacterium]
MCGSEARKGWIELVEDSDPVRAELVRGRLESEGMGVVLETVPLSMMPMPTGRSTRYRLWVRVADEAEARRLLKEKVPASELEKAARESALESPDPKPKT